MNANEEQVVRTGQLLDVFKRSVREAFGFLNESHRLEWDVKVYAGDKFEAVDSADLPDNSYVWSEATFIGDRSRIRVWRGEREATIATLVQATPETSEYALWEWLQALGRDPRPAQDADWTTTPERLQKVVDRMGHALEENLGAILAANPFVIARVESARAELALEWRRQQAEDEHRRVAARAAEAFRSEQFQRVVDLLERIEPELTPAERKKLAYAKARAAQNRTGKKEPLS